MRNRKKFVSILAGLMAAVMVLSLILSLVPRAGASSSSEIKNQINDLQNQKSQIREQMQDLKDQYVQTQDEIANLVSQKGILDQEVFLLHTEIENINQQIQAYNLLIADKQEELEQAQDRLDALNEEHKDRIRTMEEEGELSYWSVVFNAKSFSDLLDRLNMIQEIAASDQRRLKELNDAAEVVANAQAALEEERTALEATRAELDISYAELAGKQEESEMLIQEFLEKMAEIDGLRGDFEAREAELMNEIAAKEKEYTEAKRQEYLAYMATYTTAPPETIAPPPTTQSTQATQATEDNTATQATNAPQPDVPEETQATEAPTEATEATEPPTQATEPETVTWLMPCSYTRLSSPFGEREAPTEGASTYHQGVDLAGPEGTPIYATRSGTVTTASISSSAGVYVSINHGDGFASIYMHMTHYVVSAGQQVTGGQLIGYMGSTGISTGPHLHFGISYNGVYVNPANYLYFY